MPALAERYLGSAARAEEIYQANRDVLRDPKLLPIGVELKLPPRASGGRGFACTRVVKGSLGAGAVGGWVERSDDPPGSLPPTWWVIASLDPPYSGRYTNFVSPGTATGYLPSLSGRMGGVASKAYFAGASFCCELIACSHVNAWPV